MNDYKVHIGRRVLVFTEFLTFEGTLARAGKDSLSLENTAVVAEDSGRRPVDGVVMVPRESVQWLQVP